MTADQDLSDPRRRSLLKLGLLGGAMLATAGIAAGLASGSGSSPPLAGFQTLRADDMPFLQAVVPVILAGAVLQAQMPGALSATLKNIDDALAQVSPAMLKLTRQLFDVCSSSLTRGPLTGVWSGWDSASPAQVEAFLLRWRDSSLDLFRQGHNALLQLVLMAWYSCPDSWGHCGYPGPPKF
jgi:hypothetical protein